MNKKMRKLLEAIQSKTAEAKKAMTDGETKDVAKATSLLDEVDALKAEFEAEKRLFEAEKEQNAPTDDEIHGKKEQQEEKNSIKAFADAARQGFKASMNEGTAAQGGYTVPEDIRTQITEYRASKASLLGLVRIEKVQTNKGQRTFKTRSQQTGFTKVGEGGKISKTSSPQFERLTYEIDKYAGYFPVTNELLADSDANIANTLIEWIGDESRVTANKLILATINDGVSAVALGDLDGIKKAINVTLGQAFKSTAKIVTNDDGLQYLDTLKDTTGRYLLTPIPSEPGKVQLSIGGVVIPVEVIPNEDMVSDTTSNAGHTRVPFIIGDLNEGVVYWDRELMTISNSNVAAIGELNAFEEDLTIYRAIEREDVTLRDKKAIVNGYIELGE